MRILFISMVFTMIISTGLAQTSPAGKDSILQHFQQLRNKRDILAENAFVNEKMALLLVDTTMTPVMLSIMDRLAADNDSLLPRETSTDQRSVLNKMGEVAMDFYYANRPDLVIRFDSTYIRINKRLHQYATWPYQNLSFLHVLQGRTKEALAVAFDAVRLADTPAGLRDGVGYESAARVYFMIEDYDKCLEYTNKALPLLLKDPLQLEYPGAFLYRTVQILIMKNRAAEALHLLRVISAPPLFSRITRRDLTYLVVSTAECFHALGRNDSAERYYEKTLTLLYQGPNAYRYFKFMPYNSMAAFYFATHQYIRARSFLDSLLAIGMGGMTTPNFYENTWILRYQVDSALGNFPRAMADLRQYQRLHDSLNNVTGKRQLDEMNVQYETDKKNQHIADLEKQNALETRLRLSTLLRERIIRNSLIGGAILLALLAAGLYNRYRAKLRTNRLLLAHEEVINASNRQLQQVNAAQQKLIGEKEWLLREIHHRVKNNLQIVISLLNMQSRQLKDQIAVTAFEDIGARINSISLVHKKLYQQGREMATIEMLGYITEMISHLQHGLCAQRDIRFRQSAEPIFLDAAQAVPVGLIINEAVTNSIKYAFPDETIAFPEIAVGLHNQADGWLELTVADNGVGLPVGFDPEKSDSLGMQLIQTLTLQLEGSIAVNNNAGLAIRICFPRAEQLPDQTASDNDVNVKSLTFIAGTK